MDTLPLPPRPNLEQYKKRAKDLVAAANSKDPAAVRSWATAWLGTLAKLLGVTVTPFVQGSFDRAVAHIEERVRERLTVAGAKFALAEAQLLIAQAHGFENWAEFASHVERPFRGHAEGREFEAAADAIVSGDLATLEDDGSPLMTALASWYGGAAETLARRGARLDNVVSAAALGREDLVRSFVIDSVTLAPGVRAFDTRWLRTPPEPKAHIEMAFVAACHFGRTAVAEFFLGIGVDPAAKDKDDMTALHWAAANGLMDIGRRLLERGAPLEVKNTWGGTVLDSTAYFAVFQPIDGVDYSAVLEFLIGAGADVGVLRAYPAGNELIDDLLQRHGGRSG